MADADMHKEAGPADVEVTENDAGVVDAPIEDVADGSAINLTPDGGVSKKVLQEGQSVETPEKGDEVFVHYTGTLLDGTKFDSSRDRDAPFSFKLGEGRVIKGWDIGVATMRKGEKAILTCKSDYAYGAQGSPPTIPPHATLNFEVELLRWQSLKDICGDGGVMKTIVTEKGGYDLPSERDEVTVSYKVRVAGSDQVVDQSPEGGVDFTISSPNPPVLPGVLAAVKTMKKGEVVSLKLSPAYGYGAEGNADKGVGPASVLDVEVELHGWKKVEDVTDDGGVVRKVLSGPERDYKTPNQGAKVTLRYTAKLADGTVFDQRLEGNELVFTTDEEQVPEGLDLTVLKMKAGEKDIVTISPKYGYGDVEHAGPLAPVPAGSSLTYEVELVAFENAAESWEMNDDEKVAHAAVLKDRGNKAFKDGKLERAVRFYDKAVSGISYDKSFPDEAKAQARELRKTCHLNLAAVKVKLGSWREVVKNCDKVLEADTDNIKALYRRAQAYMSVQDFLEAEMDVKRGLCLQPDNADLQNLSKRLKVAQREFSKKESALYSKMFKKSAEPSAKPAEPASTQSEDVSNNSVGGTNISVSA